MSDKIIVFDKPVYTKIWSGGIDQIISYDPKPEVACANFTVKNIVTGEERKHATAVNALSVSFYCNKDSFDKVDDECIKYLISKGMKYFDRLPSRFNELIYDTSKDIDNLLDGLKKINSGELEVKTAEEDNEIYLDNKDSEVCKLEAYACGALITPSGGCNWDNINKLRNEGFSVFAGEKDSFGWLIGCIRTAKGILTYG